MNKTQQESFSCENHSDKEGTFLYVSDSQDSIITKFLCKNCASLFNNTTSKYLIDIEQVFDKNDIIYQWPPLQNRELMLDLVNNMNDKNKLTEAINDIEKCINEIKHTLNNQLDDLQNNAMAIIKQSSGEGLLQKYNNLIERDRFTDLIKKKHMGDDSELKKYARYMFCIQKKSMCEVEKNIESFNLCLKIADQLKEISPNFNNLLDEFKQTKFIMQHHSINQKQYENELKDSFLKEVNSLLSEISKYQWDSYADAISGMKQQSNKQFMLQQKFTIPDNLNNQKIDRSDLDSLLIKYGDDESWYIVVEEKQKQELFGIKKIYYDYYLQDYVKLKESNNRQSSSLGGGLFGGQTYNAGYGLFVPPSIQRSGGLFGDLSQPSGPTVEKVIEIFETIRTKQNQIKEEIQNLLTLSK